jgi:hypothetical protein
MQEPRARDDPGLVDRACGLYFKPASDASGYAPDDERVHDPKSDGVGRDDIHESFTASTHHDPEDLSALRVDETRFEL